MQWGAMATGELYNTNLLTGLQAFKLDMNSIKLDVNSNQGSPVQLLFTMEGYATKKFESHQPQDFKEMLLILLI